MKKGPRKAVMPSFVFVRRVYCVVKVRFLDSIYISGTIDKVFNFNDEFDLDKQFAEKLKASGYVDILAEEKKPVKKVARAKKVEKGEA